VTIAGPADVVFVKGGMVPAAAASFSLSFVGQVRHIRVSEEGMISHGDE
jgi:hypothetical protein